MDVHLLDAEPTTAERDAIDAFLGPPMSSWVGAERGADGHAADGGRAARAERHRLLPTLHALHERAGWISPGALNYIARRLTVPPADVYGVATFYALFSLDAASAAGSTCVRRRGLPVRRLGSADRNPGASRSAPRAPTSTARAG